MSKTVLEQGKAALQAGDYQGAIALLESLCQSTRDLKILTRARKTLVRAYLSNDDTTAAVSLCRSLIHPPVQPENVWALKVLKKLKNQQKLAEAQPQQAGERAWRNAAGAKQWQPLKPTKRGRLRLAGGVGAITLFWLIHTTLALGIKVINLGLAKIPFLPTLSLDFMPYFAIALLLLVVASPWFLCALLDHFYHLRSLPFADFRQDYPQATRSLQRACRQSQLPLPHLELLPTEAPLIFIYGHFWQTTHLVMSQGLLHQLPEPELATLIAAQIGHRASGDGIFLSAAVTLLQIPYTLYQLISAWGDRQTPFLRGIAAIGAGLAYGIYWLWRLPLLWLSKLRIYYSDRFAVEVTGDPNALSRAILRVATGISQHITQTQQTPWLLEGFDLLLPVGYQQGISIGSMPASTAFETVLAWECLNPYRHWLNFFNSHPLLGDRLYVLASYARGWKLPPELDLTTITPSVKTHAGRYQKLKQSYLALPLFQSACLTSFVFLAIFKVLFRIVTWVSPGQVFRIYQALPLLNACALVTFSLCIIVWINNYFPDIKNPTQQAAKSLPDLLANQATVPPHSQPVYLQGKILGRRGISNWLSQDIFLQTDQGLVQLQFMSRFGLLGNLVYNSVHLNELVNETVIVRGWFRRAGNIWIDIDQVILNNHQKIQGGYPFWLTGLAMGAAVWAAYLILNA